MSRVEGWGYAEREIKKERNRGNSIEGLTMELNTIDQLNEKHANFELFNSAAKCFEHSGR